MEFELERQTLETRNERLIHGILGGILLAAGGFHLTNYLFHVVPLESPLPFVVYMFAGSVASFGLVLWLRGEPPYHEARKYVVSLAEVVFFTIGFFGMAQVLREVWALALLTTLPIAVLSLTIVLSALRYNVHAVFLAGIASIVAYVSIVLYVTPPAWRPGALFEGPMLLLAVTIVVSYTVRSLIGLHSAVQRKAQLARFLPPELVQRVAEHPEILEQETEQRVATVLFTDIRGFTSLSEQMTPHEVVQFLNMFLEEMTDSVMDHRGMLDKYIGDCVMGVYGVPFTQGDHACDAVSTAIDMCRRMHGLNERLRQAGKVELGMGIGIHTGEVVVGALGSSRRLEYTVIGDTVNVASRIEALTRKYPVDILVSDATRDAVGERIPMREIDTVQVKGREQAVRLWTPC